MKKIDLNKITPVGTYKCATSQKSQKLDIQPNTDAPFKLIDIVPIKATNKVIHIYRQEVQLK